MSAVPASPSSANSFNATLTVPPFSRPSAVSRAIMREKAFGIPADEKVSSTQKNGYAIWYNPAPYPPKRLVSGIR